MIETRCFDCSHPAADHTQRDGCTALDYLDGSTKGMACLCWFTPEWAAHQPVAATTTDQRGAGSSSDDE